MATQRPTEAWNVVFCGSGFGSCGLPEPWHSYLMVAAPWEEKDSGLCVIVSLTDGPTPSPPSVVVHSGGPAAAVELGRALLRRLSGNQGLREHASRFGTNLAAHE
jgi:hypothetical protein